MPPASAPDALRGVRIGVMRFSAGFGTDAPFEAALDVLRAQGAEPGRDRRVRSGRQEIGRNEIVVLLAELKRDLNAYLATLPAAVRTRTLADLIAFNREHAADGDAAFGQDLFEQAEATPGLDDAYRTARETSLRLAGAEGHRPAAARAQCRRPGRADPAGRLADRRGPWRPAARRRRAGGARRGRRLSAPDRADGRVRGLPVGLSFIGPKWSDALILSLGYAYEQATTRRIEPRFLPSIEESAGGRAASAAAPAR